MRAHVPPPGQPVDPDETPDRWGLPPLLWEVLDGCDGVIADQPHGRVFVIRADRVQPVDVRTGTPLDAPWPVTGPAGGHPSREQIRAAIAERVNAGY